MRFLPVLCVLLLASVHSFCQSVPVTPTTSPAPSKEAGTISGTVFRADTGEPLKKARVTLDDRGAETVYVVYVTDEQGHFAFEDVPPGSYHLNVSRNGFVDAEYGQTRPGAAGAVLTLAAGQSMTDLVFKLARAGAISGHVFDEDGEPVAKASIIFYRASKRSGKEQRNDDQPVLTNDLGAYRIFDLAPGRYYVAVNYRSEDWLPHPSPAANQKIDTGYLPSYYANTTDSARAQAISVGPGDEIGSVDFFLRPSLVVTVSGKVINTTAMPPNSSGRVRLEPRGSGLVDAVQNLSDDFRGKDGSFTIAMCRHAPIISSQAGQDQRPENGTLRAVRWTSAIPM